MTCSYRYIFWAFWDNVHKLCLRGGNHLMITQVKQSNNLKNKFLFFYLTLTKFEKYFHQSSPPPLAKKILVTPPSPTWDDIYKVYIVIYIYVYVYEYTIFLNIYIYIYIYSDDISEWTSKQFLAKVRDLIFNQMFIFNQMLIFN